ncbi:MAG: hypothetical protein ABIP74_02115 [Candidatus Saccharimonas sp.]
MPLSTEIHTENQHSTNEILDPRNLPEIAFQSYEMLENNFIAVRQDFLAGKFRNPRFEHPKLKTAILDMDNGIEALAQAKADIASVEPDEDRRSVIVTTIDYRIAEMEYVKLLSKLDYLVHEKQDNDEVFNLVVQAKETSEHLYGEVDLDIVDMCLNSVWGNLDSKQYRGKARQLYDDLHNGFTMAEGYEISPMRRSDKPDLELPKFGEAVKWAGEYFLEKNSDIFALAQTFWEQKVAEKGESYRCSSEDMVEFLKDVISMRDPENLAGIAVKTKAKSETLSWNTADMALYVGSSFANRAIPIDNPIILATRTLHEFGHHAQAAINGLKTGLPVLATGLYTATHDPDYLSFEEGFASVIESAIDGNQPELDGGGLDYYLDIAFAAEGDDYRTVFEKSWRYILLKGLSEDQDVTDEMIDEAQRKAYMRCARVFRGTPTEIGDKLGVVPTFNKDLAYIHGKLKALQYLEMAYKKQNTAYLDLALLTKSDLTNPVQFAVSVNACSRAGMFDRSLIDENIE